MTAQAYPLQWPQGRRRTLESQRKRAKFGKGQRVFSSDNKSSWTRKRDLTVAEAADRLKTGLMQIGANHIVVSTNLELRNDGLPRSGQREPADPGVCIYFSLGGKPRAMPCDTYDRVADNLAAVAAHIDATRAIERHGVATVAEMFEGFTALPAPGQTAKRPWWQVLQIPNPKDATKVMVDYAYRELAKKMHPDVEGGSDQAMAELNAARAEALRVVA